MYKISVRYFVYFFLLCHLATSAAQQNSGPKNILYIMLDDAGFFDFGYNNHILQQPDAVTPNIDLLRANGKAFNQFYSGSAVCTPTRVSVLTGDMPVGHGALDAWPQVARLNQKLSGNSGLSDTIPQLGHIMRQLGKKTAHHGKWHVGLSREQYRHEALGFDNFSYHQVVPTTDFSNWSGDYRFVSNDSSEILDVDYIDYYYTQKVIDFIDENWDQGLFINFWPLTPHYPFTPPRNFSYSDNGLDPSLDPAKGGGDRGGNIGTMFAIDQQIGLIVDKLREKNILDDTLIVITSDNGATRLQQNKERWHRGNKGTFYEGGVRMPMVAHWPNGIASGSSNDSVMTTYDLLPTFMELLGKDPSYLYDKIDGRSKAAAFTGAESISHNPILWQMNGSSLRSADVRADKVYALRDGNYKLVKIERRNDVTNPKAYFLFDVVNDRQEKTDLREIQPAIYEQMKSDMLKMRLSESLYKDFPKFVARNSASIPFDPRLDVTSKDMTLVMNMLVPQQLRKTKNIYNKPGSQILTIRKDRSLRWTVTGSTPADGPKLFTLKSDPLAPGVHQIGLVIGGFKNDFAQLELYIDGEKVDQLDDSDSENGMLSVWSTISNPQIGDRSLIFGDSRLILWGIRYYTARFWPDEWNAL